MGVNRSSQAHKTKHQSSSCEDKELSGSRDLSKTRWPNVCAMCKTNEEKY